MKRVVAISLWIAVGMAMVVVSRQAAFAWPAGGGAPVPQAAVAADPAAPAGAAGHSNLGLAVEAVGYAVLLFAAIAALRSNGRRENMAEQTQPPPVEHVHWHDLLHVMAYSTILLGLTILMTSGMMHGGA